ncbi:MAG: hypothetical protein ACLVJH_10635 [Faecalibacterium prausnitzii]
MAKYKKVKRYHRSFYSPGMWVKKAVGIIVLVAVVLVVGWLAAPHVLDWATHTWYTVVRNRDLSASSETTASSAAASSEVTAEPAASSEVRADSEPGSEPAAPAGVIIEGSWGVLDTAAAKDEASLRAAARQLAQQGAAYAVVTLKDSAGNILYPSQVAAAAGSIEGRPLTRPSSPRCSRRTALCRWQSWRPSATPSRPAPTAIWPSATPGRLTSGWIIRRPPAAIPGSTPIPTRPSGSSATSSARVQSMGFDHVLLENVQFPLPRTASRTSAPPAGATAAPSWLRTSPHGMPALRAV